MKEKLPFFQPFASKQRKKKKIVHKETEKATVWSTANFGDSSRSSREFQKASFSSFSCAWINIQFLIREKLVRKWGSNGQNLEKI